MHVLQEDKRRSAESIGVCDPLKYNKRQRKCTFVQVKRSSLEVLDKATNGTIQQSVLPTESAADAALFELVRYEQQALVKQASPAHLCDLRACSGC